MPEDSKKNQQRKGRNDAKEQRKPRQTRRQAPLNEKPAEKVETMEVPAPEKFVYEEPGPEFYKNLKRETHEILKITEEENAKYRSKEIKSNWTKYEMPIKTYEDYEEEQSRGADYEELLQAPVGGHFQFKHEKSGDISTGPSLYAKYFEIDMERLSLAVNTIPFYERFDIDKSIFSETDIENMNKKATKYKQMYYNDKSYTTPEMEAEEKIINSLKEKEENLKIKEDHNDEQSAETKPIIESEDIFENFKIDVVDVTASPINIAVNNENTILEPAKTEIPSVQIKNIVESKKIVDFDDIILGNDDNYITKLSDNSETNNNLEDDVKMKNVNPLSEPTVETKVADTEIEKTSKVPVIESPEDLEKWLDDFLDD